MDEWLCSSTHNKDDVEALDKCAPLARFISFVPVPFKLGDRKELAYLHVDNNRLIGMVPLKLGELQKLQKLGQPIKTT